MWLTPWNVAFGNICSPLLSVNWPHHCDEIALPIDFSLLFLINIYNYIPVQIISIWNFCRFGCSQIVQIISLEFFYPILFLIPSQSVTWTPPPLPSHEVFSFFLCILLSSSFVVSIIGSWLSLLLSLFWSLLWELDPDTAHLLSFL